jgi:hypothetical protein
VRVQEAAELVAIDVFQRAEATGQPITVGLVERRLDELRSHEPECACGLCTAASEMRASRVFYVARGWAGGSLRLGRRAAHPDRGRDCAQ